MKHLPLLFTFLLPLAIAPVALAAETPITWPDLSSPVVTGGGERDAAVIVGIESYASIDRVQGARDNATDWYRQLVQGRKIPATSTFLLTNEQAINVEILQKAREAVKKVKPGGTLWFVFIGHGAPGRSGSEGLLVGYDATRSAVGIESRSLRHSELLAELQKGPQANTVLVLDACFSGRNVDGKELIEGLQFVVPSYDDLPTGSATILTAAKADQYAGALPGLQRPAFSYLVLGALRGWADTDANGSVTATETVEYTRDMLLQLARNRRQEPQLLGETQQIVMGRGREKGPSIENYVLQASQGSASLERVGQIETKAGEGDYAAQLEALKRAKAQREEGERKEMELQAKVKAEQDRRIEAGRAQLLKEASSLWAASQELVKEGGPEAQAALKGYIEKYGSAELRIDGRVERVEIPQVGEARRAMEGLGGGSRSAVLARHGLKMLEIKPGSFTMGSPEGETGREADERQHTVTISKAYYLSDKEVTQGLWEAVMGENPSATRQMFWDGKEQGACSGFGVGDDLPVHCVDWMDTLKFANRLSEMEGLKPAYSISGATVTWNAGANGYRLPTEAEWEYAARAGSGGLYAGAASDAEVCRVANVANVSTKAKYSLSWEVFSCDDSYEVLAPVGVFRPNAWGLYDMTGNVYEWCWDWYGDYPPGSVRDPAGPQSGSLRVLRGGSWVVGPAHARVALRFRDSPSFRVRSLGLRLARSVP